MDNALDPAFHTWWNTFDARSIRAPEEIDMETASLIHRYCKAAWKQCKSLNGSASAPPSAGRSNALRWTKEKPTKDGAYLCRAEHSGLWAQSWAVNVITASAGVFVNSIFAPLMNIESYSQHEWLGPIGPEAP